MKAKNFLLSILLAVACVGVVVVGTLPSANSFSGSTASVQIEGGASSQAVTQGSQAVTIAATQSNVETNPAKTQNIATYDLYQFEDFKYSNLENGKMTVIGYSQTGFEKASAAIDAKGMFSMSMPRDSRVTEVQSDAFFYTTALRAYVEKLYIPSNITRIGRTAFHYFENMTDLYFEDGTQELTLLGQAFYGACSLKSLYLPARVRYENDPYPTNPFGIARSLEHIYVDKNNPRLSSRDWSGNECNCVTNRYPSGWYSLTTLVTGCKNTVIPDTVSALSEQAFMYNEIEHVTVPSNVKRLGFEAFAGTKLKTLVLPKNMETLGQAAFYDCRDLKSVVLPTNDFDVVVGGNNLEWTFIGTYALQCLVADNIDKAAELNTLFREYGHLVTYEIEVIYHFMDGHVETDKKLFSRDLSWTLQEDGSWDVGTYSLRPGTWADASGKELGYDDVNSLVSSGEVTSAINLYQTKLPQNPVDPDDPDNPDKPVDPDHPGDDGKVEGQGSRSGNGVVKHLWWIIPLVIIALALLIWAAFAIVAAITGVAGLAGFAVLFAMIFRRKEDEDDWLKRVLKIIRKKV